VNAEFRAEAPAINIGKSYKIRIGIDRPGDYGGHRNSVRRLIGIHWILEDGLSHCTIGIHFPGTKQFLDVHVGLEHCIDMCAVMVVN